ncbi:hypothetical protein [Nitratiruptor sp. YY09-18]|uniref:hypothetical protein n=1 Tax=Nitratiruptor sp. YY09-18 TaxID=2724901 RepID=UPI001915B6FA|nr:hypothetical protein [Nitratiruptor sp. YY09-18]BCD67476.1 hypothetical protein NitYY0918_C0369 [Nitratiruptor sp. YY09-18]
MKKLSIVSFMAASLLAGDIVLPYGGYIAYTGNTKRDSAYLAGVFLSHSTKKYALDVDLEYMRISYDGGIPTYKQKSAALLYHYYQGEHIVYEIGMNNIFTDQGNNDDYQKVFTAGILYYDYLHYNYGVNLHYSSYDGFHVWQVSPKVGINFGDYKSQIGSFYAQVQYNYINISEDWAALKDNYSNADIKLTNFNGSFTTTAQASFGKNAYKVAKEGFVVFNLGEEYHTSYGLSVAKALSKNSSLKIQGTRARFYEQNKKAHSNIFVVSYTRAF